MATFTPKVGIFKKTYSSESFARDLKALMVANLNNFIDGMNVDKPDLTLKQVAADAYFFQTLNERVVNLDPFIFFYEANVASDSVGPETSKKYTYIVSLILTLGNETPEDRGYEVLRYRECLERLFEQAWNSINPRIKTEISAFPPQLVSINSPDDHLGAGVALLFDLT